jgi:hypothetical protein
MKDLQTKFEALISDWELAAPKTIFGYEVYGANRKMFAWVNDDSIALTALPEAERNIVTEKFGAYPFAMPDRVFKKWLIIPVPDAVTFKKLIPFMKKSYETAFAESMKPKPARSRSKTKKLR